MRRFFEDATGQREYGRLVDRRPDDRELSFAPEGPDRRGGIESGDVLAGGDATRDGKVALNEVWSGRHVLVHPGPAVLLYDEMKQIQRGVVIGRIAGDQLSREHRLEEIRRRSR